MKGSRSPCSQCLHVQRQRNQFQSERDRARNRIIELEASLAEQQSSPSISTRAQGVTQDSDTSTLSLRARLVELSHINSQLQDANTKLAQNQQQSRNHIALQEQVRALQYENAELEGTIETLRQANSELTVQVEELRQHSLRFNEGGASNEKDQIQMSLERKDLELAQVRLQLSSIEATRRGLLQKAKDDKEMLEQVKQNAQVSRRDALALRQDAVLARQERDAAIQERMALYEEVQSLKQQLTEKEQVVPAKRGLSVEEDVIDIAPSPLKRQKLQGNRASTSKTPVMRMDYVLIPPLPYTVRARKLPKVPRSPSPSPLPPFPAQPTFRLTLPGFGTRPA